MQQLAQPAEVPGVTINFHLSPESVQVLARAIVSAMGAQAQAVVQTLPSGCRRIRRLRSARWAQADDPAGQPEGTAVYYHDTEKASYRPARGTKRKGEERVFLTPEDVADAKAKGMLGSSRGYGEGPGERMLNRRGLLIRRGGSA